MMMPMWFENSDRVKLLFENFKSDKGETGKYIGLLVFVVALGFLLEVVNYLRYQKSLEFKNKEKTGSFKMMLIMTYGLSVTLAYALMLCVMSFNVGVFFATIVGLTIGNFVFSPMKRTLAFKKKCEEDQTCCKPTDTQPVNETSGRAME